METVDTEFFFLTRFERNCSPLVRVFFHIYSPPTGIITHWGFNAYILILLIEGKSVMTTVPDHSHNYGIFDIGLLSQLQYILEPTVPGLTFGIVFS